jgi:RecA-family ATPase
VRQRVRAKVLHDDIAEELPFADLTGRIDLRHDLGVVVLIATLRQIHNPADELLLIVDTVSRAMAGGDENSSQDMGALIGTCDRIRAELPCTVLLIHHAGKDTTKGARGHSSLRAAVDTEIEVTGTANPRVITVRKQRDLPSGETFAFDLEPVELGTDKETYDPISACVAVYRDEVPKGQDSGRSPSGKAQRQLLAGLRNLQKDAEQALIWTLEDLRAIGRTGGLSKPTARSVVESLTLSGFLRPSVGGYTLPDAN